MTGFTAEQIAANTFTDDELIRRLEVLWDKLNNEGMHTGANTAALCIIRIKQTKTSKPNILLLKQ